MLDKWLQVRLARLADSQSALDLDAGEFTSLIVTESKSHPEAFRLLMLLLSPTWDALGLQSLLRTVTMPALLSFFNVCDVSRTTLRSFQARMCSHACPRSQGPLSPFYRLGYKLRAVDHTASSEVRPELGCIWCPSALRNLRLCDPIFPTWILQAILVVGLMKESFPASKGGINKQWILSL